MTLQPRPPLTVLLGPARAGKTRACLDLAARDPEGSIVAVPSEALAKQLRGPQKASPRPPAVVSFGALINSLAGQSEQGPFRTTFRRRLLAGLVARLVEDGSCFSRTRSAPGFVAALDDAFHELRLSCVAPSDLESAAAVVEERAPDLGRKTREVAALYRACEEVMVREGLPDPDTLPAVAAQLALKAPAGALPRALFVDGSTACRWRGGGFWPRWQSAAAASR